MVQVDHGIAAERGSFKPATTQLPWIMYFYSQFKILREKLFQIVKNYGLMIRLHGTMYKSLKQEIFLL